MSVLTVSISPVRYGRLARRLNTRHHADWSAAMLTLKANLGFSWGRQSWGARATQTGGAVILAGLLSLNLYPGILPAPLHQLSLVQNTWSTEGTESPVRTLWSALPWLHSQEEELDQAVASFEEAAPHDAQVSVAENRPSRVVDYVVSRYRVSRQSALQIVRLAYESGIQSGMDPHLILAVIAVESAFNPQAESDKGAQGLMQVMTSVHEDKYQRLGGSHLVWDPKTNILVGTQVLKNCIDKAGSLVDGLRYYVGAANFNYNGYGNRVLAERERIKRVAAGQKNQKAG